MGNPFLPEQSVSLINFFSTNFSEGFHLQKKKIKWEKTFSRRQRIHLLHTEKKLFKNKFPLGKNTFHRQKYLRMEKIKFY